MCECVCARVRPCQRAYVHAYVFLRAQNAIQAYIDFHIQIYLAETCEKCTQPQACLPFIPTPAIHLGRCASLWWSSLLDWDPGVGRSLLVEDLLCGLTYILQTLEGAVGRKIHWADGFVSM